MCGPFVLSYLSRCFTQLNRVLYEAAMLPDVTELETCKKDLFVAHLQPRIDKNCEGRAILMTSP